MTQGFQSNCNYLQVLFLFLFILLNPFTVSWDVSSETLVYLNVASLPKNETKRTVIIVLFTYKILLPIIICYVTRFARRAAAKLRTRMAHSIFSGCVPMAESLRIIFQFTQWCCRSINSSVWHFSIGSIFWHFVGWYILG